MNEYELVLRFQAETQQGAEEAALELRTCSDLWGAVQASLQQVSLREIPLRDHEPEGLTTGDTDRLIRRARRGEGPEPATPDHSKYEVNLG